jgi:hypothetical protein
MTIYSSQKLSGDKIKQDSIAGYLACRRREMHTEYKKGKPERNMTV